MKFTTTLKHGLLSIISRSTLRHAVLLPNIAESTDSILEVDTPYRVEGRELHIKILAPGAGQLRAQMFGYYQTSPNQLLWTGESIAYQGPCEIVFKIFDGAVTIDGKRWGELAVSRPTRRFSFQLVLTRADGTTLSRQTGHYVAGTDDRAIDASYFEGDNYVSYDDEAQSEYSTIIDMLNRHNVSGPVLDVGCATGGLLLALDALGKTSYGIEVSEWAISQAKKRISADRLWIANIEKDPMPESLRARAPFGAFVMWAVLEHCADPFGVIAKLSALARPGTLLAFNVPNADGIGHKLFGKQWEAHYDWTHKSENILGVQSMRRELPKLGWRILEMRSHTVWDMSADPTHATLRDWWQADARFRQLLGENDLGDLLHGIAIKE